MGTGKRQNRKRFGEAAVLRRNIISGRVRCCLSRARKTGSQSIKFIVKIIKAVSPKSVLTMHEVGKAMINAVTVGYPKNVLEITDIKELAKV